MIPKTNHSFCYCNSPVGVLKIEASIQGICAIHFEKEKTTVPNGRHLPELPLLKQAVLELEEYFQGKRQYFTLPVSLNGTAFQMTVWHALTKIPYGTTCTYGELAASIGNPKACRAVGMANNKNPLPILIPCHRVIGKGGKLVGYGAGLDIKEKLLALEQQVATC